MALTPKGIWTLIGGLALMVLGYVLMAGGGSDNPQVFNYDMFNFRRLVAAPVLIVAGIIIDVVAIMGSFKKKQ